MTVLSAFPTCLQADIEQVLACFGEFSVSDEGVSYQLVSGETVRVPYRLYMPEVPNLEGLSPQQQLIAQCLLTRHSNGFIREQHLKKLLTAVLPDWCYPFLVKLADEYILSVLVLLLTYLGHQERSALRQFCELNQPQLQRGHQRMLSYWNEYYRKKYPDFTTYPGYFLYQTYFLTKH